MTSQLIKPSIIALLSFLLSGCGLITDGINYTHPKNPRYFYLNTDSDPTLQEDTLKVVSYNIEFAKKIAMAAELLSSDENLRDADIIFLQEMDAKGVKEIAQTLNYNYIYYPAVRHPLYNRDFGNAILTKWPILYDEKVILPHLDPDKLQRIAVGAVLNIKDKHVMAYSVHMRVWLKPFQRKSQMDRLLQPIPSNIKYCIIAGDFNTFSEFNRETIYAAFNESDFTLATKNIEATYRHWYLLNKRNLVDFIFTRNMETIESGVVEEKKISDHFPIWAKMKFE